MRKFRLIFSILLLAAVSCNRSANVDISETALNDLKLLPAEPAVLFYCDFAKITSSSLAQEFMPLFDDHMHKDFFEEEFEQFKKITGFDPEKDLTSILAAVEYEGFADRKPYFIIHGKFAEDKIIGYMQNKANEENEEIPWFVEKINDKNLYVFKDSRTDIGFTFESETTVYLGKTNWIKNIITNKEEIFSKQRLADLKKSVLYGDQFWLTVNIPEAEGPESFADVIGKFPLSEKISSVSMSAKLNDKLNFHGQISCDNPETSRLMVDMMKGALAAAKLRVYKDREAVDALNRIKMETKGNRVYIDGNLNQEFFDKLKEYRMSPWGLKGKRSI